jgi:hypothetical protein
VSSVPITPHFGQLDLHVRVALGQVGEFEASRGTGSRYWRGSVLDAHFRFDSFSKVTGRTTKPEPIWSVLSPWAGFSQFEVDLSVGLGCRWLPSGELGQGGILQTLALRSVRLRLPDSCCSIPP